MLRPPVATLPKVRRVAFSLASFRQPTPTPYSSGHCYNSFLIRSQYSTFVPPNSSKHSQSYLTNKYMDYQDILDFWFNSETQANWFARSDDFDRQIETKFRATWGCAAQAELWDWRSSAEGRLAEIIVLDQFSRNMFRESPLAFAQDSLALGLAQESVSLGIDNQLSPERRFFLYMPFMHSESRLVHEHGLKLFEALENPIPLDFERKHKAIIDQFGRYPHRNEILGRISTPEEAEFLNQPGSSF